MKAVKTSSGKWRAKAYNKYTKKEVSFTGLSKRDVERKAQMYMATISDIKESDLTLEDAIDLYVDTNKNLWSSPRTAEGYLSFKKNYGDLLKMPLKKIDDLNVKRWMNEFALGHSPKTVKNNYSLIASVKRQYDIPLKVKLPRISKPDLVMPTQEEIKDLLKLAKDTNDKYGLYSAVYLATFTAMRRGEICALTDKAIDYKHNKINVLYSLADTQNGWVVKSPKNGKTRVISPPKNVFGVIKEYGLPKMTPRDISRHFAKMVKGKYEFTFHSLRHFCAARMLSAGIPISVVCEYGGWEDQDVLMRIYDFVIKEVRDESMKKWDEVSKTLE